MPSLAEHPSSNFVKAIVTGLSGSRKTTGLASLARAGYNLYVLDCDNGLGALIRELGSDQAALARVQYEPCYDKFKTVNGVIQLDGAVRGWPNALKALTNWPGKGPLEKWTENDVLVIDTLTNLGESALRFVMQLSNHDKATLPDFGAAMESLSKVVQMIASPAANCHVIVNTHVNYTENADGSGIIEGFPSALGNKLSPKLPIYFDNVWVAAKDGKGETAKFTYKLRGTQMIMGKSSYRGQAELPNETGLADLFKQLRGGKTPTT